MLNGIGDTGNQPAAADGDDNGIYIRELFQDFQADGTLAGDDVLVVEGMYEGEVLLLLELAGLGIGVVLYALDQNHVSSVAAGRRDFGLGGALRNTDSGADAVLFGG